MVNLHELLVPFIDIGGLFPGIGVVVAGAGRIALVVGAPLDDLLQDRLVDLFPLLANQTVIVTEAPGAKKGEVVLTLGIGIASPESPISSSMFLIRMERSATSRSTGNQWSAHYVRQPALTPSGSVFAYQARSRLHRSW